MLIYHQCHNWIRIKWFTFHALWHRPKSIIECFTWKEICKPTLDYIKQKHTLLSQTRWVCLKTFIFLNTSTRYIEGKKKNQKLRHIHCIWFISVEILNFNCTCCNSLCFVSPILWCHRFPELLNLSIFKNNLLWDSRISGYITYIRHILLLLPNISEGIQISEFWNVSACCIFDILA